MSGPGTLRILHEVALWSKGASKVKRQIFYEVAFWSKGAFKVNRQTRCLWTLSLQGMQHVHEAGRPQKR